MAITPIVRKFRIESWTDSTKSGFSVMNAILDCFERNDGKFRHWTLDTVSLINGKRTTTDGCEAIVLKNQYTDHLGNTKFQKLSLRVNSVPNQNVVNVLNSTIAAKLYTHDNLGSDPSNYVIEVSENTDWSSASFTGESWITGGFYNYSSSRYYYSNFTNANFVSLNNSFDTPDGFVIEVEDAITIVIQNNVTTAGAIKNWSGSLHAGIIYTPIELNDYNNYLDGSGILVGRPGWRKATDSDFNYWFGQLEADYLSRFQGSKIRVGQLFPLLTGSSSSPYPLVPDETYLNGASDNVDGKIRFYPIRLLSLFNNYGLIGYTKYCRIGNTNVLNQITNSDEYSNLAWISQKGVSASSTCFHHVWEKDINPIDLS